MVAIIMIVYNYRKNNVKVNWGLSNFITISIQNVKYHTQTHKQCNEHQSLVGPGSLYLNLFDDGVFLQRISCYALIFSLICSYCRYRIEYSVERCPNLLVNHNIWQKRQCYEFGVLNCMRDPSNSWIQYVLKANQVF